MAVERSTPVTLQRPVNLYGAVWLAMEAAPNINYGDQLQQPLLSVCVPREKKLSRFNKIQNLSIAKTLSFKG